MLDFDNTLIVPIPSTVNSRDEVDVSVKLTDDYTLNFPLVASPMKDIVDPYFLMSLSDLGAIGILHKFYEDKNLWRNDVAKLRFYDYGIAVGLNSSDYEYALDNDPRIILVDIAVGYISDLRKYCEKIKNAIIKGGYKTLLMAGNVVTKEGVDNLADSGVDIARLGIGSGSICSTRNATGIGYPNVSAIQDCARTDRDILLMQDGGLIYSGDFVKSIVAGADFCMAGKLFSETYESPALSQISGMASRSHQERMNIQIKSVEGFTIDIEKKHSLADFVREFSYNIRSAGSYLNARNLQEIRNNGKLIEIPTSSIKKL